MIQGLKQFAAIASLGLRIGAKDRERLVSPVMFAATILLLFAFAIGTSFEAELMIRLYVAETFLALFLALQVSFARAFEPDTQDRVFDLLRTYPLSPLAWFFGKYVQVLISGVLILLPAMALGVFFHQQAGVSLTLGSLAIALLALVGLSALGTVLSLITMGSSARQIVYPILYFPLTTPVLLAAVEATRAHLLDGKEITALFSSWLGLLGIFDIMYLTLSVLVFGELIKPD
jgi:heme exporter protein B